MEYIRYHQEYTELINLKSHYRRLRTNSIQSILCKIRRSSHGTVVQRRETCTHTRELTRENKELGAVGRRGELAKEGLPEDMIA